MLKGHTGTVRSVSFSADGRLLATASDDKTVKLWSLPGQRFAATLSGHSNWVRAAAFSPDGRLVASAGDDRCVKVRRRPAGRHCVGGCCVRTSRLRSLRVGGQ